MIFKDIYWINQGLFNFWSWTIIRYGLWFKIPMDYRSDTFSRP